jgi:hypothetical protein
MSLNVDMPRFANAALALWKIARGDGTRAPPGERKGKRPMFRYDLVREGRRDRAEMEVAARLRLSRHTVHRYAPAIQRERAVHIRGRRMAG